MATTTTKLGLTKPAYTDVVDVADLNNNADLIDAAAGFTIVANEAARPASPWTGQVIYQTDVASSFMWDGSVWQGFATVGRNLLYNGAMQVTQRGTSATGVTTYGYFTADRWRTDCGSAAEFTQTVAAEAPTGSGFANSLKMVCTTAVAPPAASDVIAFRQRLEGKDLQAIKKGTSSAEYLTLQFWVKSNVTGTYIARLDDRDNTRNVCAAYTIDSSATWEKKVITFPPDTTGVLDNNNLESLDLLLYLAAGSDYTSGTLATTWESVVPANINVGQVNLAASASNYWQVTGVQLEVGTVANGFEHKPYGVELAECQRYYQLITIGDTQAIANGYANGTDSFNATRPLHVRMRVAPSIDSTNGTGYYRINSSNNPTVNSIAVAATFNNHGALGIQGTTNTANLTTGYGLILRNNNANAYVAADSEL